MWQKIKREIRERFLNFETAKGIYLIPAGLVLIYVITFYLQFVIQAAGYITGVYMVSEGIRKVWVNRVKQAVTTDALVQERRIATIEEERKRAGVAQ